MSTASSTAAPRRSWLPWLPLPFIVVIVLVIGALGDTGPSTNEERVIAIARTVKCPECSGESVAESNSSFSRAARIEIAEQVGSVSRSMQEQTKVVESIATSSEELVRLSASMQQAVSRFKVSEESRGLALKK